MTIKTIIISSTAMPACESALRLAGFNLLHDDYHNIFDRFGFSYCRTISWMKP
jgi:hypothetical protein